MTLKLYNSKRNFSKTHEPKGKLSKQYKNLFIIQKHAATHLHYDFRLELNGVLLSWAIPKGPCLDPSIKRLAIHVEDHPVSYGNFEGIIPKGEYGQGTVMLWDKGTWTSEDKDPLLAYKKGHLRFTLKAKKLKGRFSLIKLKKDDDKSWFLIKSKDQYAKKLSEFDITQEKPNSVISNQTIDEITHHYTQVWTNKSAKKAKKKSTIKLNLPVSTMPKIIRPQLATLMDEPPVDKQWLHEIKFDGYRILSFKQGKTIRLVSRNNKDWTKHFANIAAKIKKLSLKNMIIDGEIVLLDKNQHSNFQLLQNAVKNNENDHPFIYYIFDILYYDQYNLMPLPLLERKNILEKIISSFDDPTLRFSTHVAGQGNEVFQKACSMHLEGIVSKDMNSPYLQKRTKTWIKTKCLNRQEFVVGGYTEPTGNRQYFGSLLLGVYNKNKQLVYCSRVGTGFNDASLKSLYKLLIKNKSLKNPFTSNPPGVTKVKWVKPILVVEVEFTEWTKDGGLRHPSFKGQRSDKPAAEIIREDKKSLKLLKKKNSTAIEMTHPEKTLFPEEGITKLDLANYYDSIKNWILPYIINRPLTLVRCPENYHACFYQKHIVHPTKDIYTFSIKGKHEKQNYIYIKNYDGLMRLVQMSILELHVWGSQINKVNYPDIITFDLDPAPEILWKEVVSTAFLIRAHLKKLKLKSFVKTTGGKGLHIVIPIKPEHSWEKIINFAESFVQTLVAKYPEKYIATMTKSKRKGKIFIDYLRNHKGATAIAPYSTRARAKAPIATPIDWNELTNHFKDTFYTIFTLPQRLKTLKKDPWKDFFKINQSLYL